MLAIRNNRLYFNDRLFNIIEANSPETRLRDLYYPELDELNSYGVNTLYLTCNGKESTVTINPFKNNDYNQGFDDVKVNQWRDYLEYWVLGFDSSPHILHLLLSEKETHYLLPEIVHKQMIDYLANKFSSMRGYIIWDREELDTGKAAYINTYYSYLKQVDPLNIRGMHNNTNEDPWSGFENSDLIQFLSLQEWEGNFGRRLDSLVPKNPNWAGYVSEKTGGFTPSDVSKIEPLIKCSQYNSGISFYIASKDQSFPNFQSQYQSLYQEANRVYNNQPNPNPTPTNMIVGYSTQSNRSDFKSIPATLSTGTYYIEARQNSGGVTFTLTKDGVQVLSRTENGAPFDMNGGSTSTATGYNFTAGNYTLTTRDSTGTITTNFTVGSVPQPIYGCTDPTATNYNPNATIDDGSCTYPPSTKPAVTVNITTAGDVDVIVKINGVTK